MIERRQVWGETATNDQKLNLILQKRDDHSSDSRPLVSDLTLSINRLKPLINGLQPLLGILKRTSKEWKTWSGNGIITVK